MFGNICSNVKWSSYKMSRELIEPCSNPILHNIVYCRFENVCYSTWLYYTVYALYYIYYMGTKCGTKYLQIIGFQFTHLVPRVTDTVAPGWDTCRCNSKPARLHMTSRPPNRSWQDRTRPSRCSTLAGHTALREHGKAHPGSSAWQWEIKRRLEVFI